MNEDLKVKKAMRYKFLHLLYTKVNGSEKVPINMNDLGKELMLDRYTTSDIYYYLNNEGLIVPRALGGLISITHEGIKEVERSLEYPDKPTEHFLPINVINIGTMNNSTLQQGTINSSISSVSSPKELQQIQEIITDINAIKDSLNLSYDVHKELVAEIETISLQVQSPKPKQSVLKFCLQSIKTILEGVGIEVLTSGVIGKITSYIAV